MKTKSVVSLFTLLCVISLMVEACTMPGAGTPLLVPPTALPNPAVRVNMYHPLNGSIYSIGEVILLAGNLRGEQLQISASSFLVNGASVAANTRHNNTYGSMDGTWTASEPGEYYFQARVTLNDGSSAISEPHRICVTPTSVAAPTGWGEGSGYLGPCPLATRIPNPASTGNLAFNVVASPNVIRTTLICSDVTQPLTPAITFVAHVNDPQDLVALVHVSILGPAGGGPLWNSYLNWVTTRPTNQKEYRGTLQNPSNVFSGVGRIDSVHWQAIAYGRDGQQIQMVEGVITVQLIDCNQHPQPPTPTPTAAVLEVVPQLPSFIPPTFTLTMNSFCRRGPNMSFSTLTSFTAGETGDILNISEDGIWYFVDWKKADAKCWVATRTGDASGDLTGLKVLIVPTLSAPEPPSKKPTVPPESEPALPPASGCSSYGDASSCTTNGCSWDKPTSSCH